jgi:hypothetical protein
VYEAEKNNIYQANRKCGKRTGPLKVRVAQNEEMDTGKTKETKTKT